MSRVKSPRFILTVLGSAAVFALGVWYFVRHLHDFKKVLEIDAGSFAALSALVLIAVWLSGLTIYAIVRVFRVNISMWESFGLSAVNTMANFYISKSGIAAKGLYLNRRHQFPYAQFISTVAGNYVISLVTQGIMGLILYLWFLRGSALRFELLLAFVGFTLAGLAPLVVPRLKISSTHRVWSKVQSVIDGWQELRTHRMTLLVLVLLNVSYVVVGGFRLFVSYRALGYAVDLLPCLVMSPISALTVVLSFTPGAVGIRQALVGYSSELLGVGLTHGVVASTVDHAVGTLWIFVVGLTFTNWIWARSIRAGTGKQGEKG